MFFTSTSMVNNKAILEPIFFKFCQIVAIALIFLCYLIGHGKKMAKQCFFRVQTFFYRFFHSFCAPGFILRPTGLKKNLNGKKGSYISFLFNWSWQKMAIFYFVFVTNFFLQFFLTVSPLMASF